MQFSEVVSLNTNFSPTGIRQLMAGRAAFYHANPASQARQSTPCCRCKVLSLMFEVDQ